jgi:hypothetical protein
LESPRGFLHPLCRLLNLCILMSNIKIQKTRA